MTEIEQTDSDGKVEAQKRPLRRRRTGVVESDARDKTIMVRIDRLIQHRKYGKYLRRRGALHAHDEKNEASVGDTVEITESRPISKTKSWRLSKILRKTADG